MLAALVVAVAACGDENSADDSSKASRKVVVAALGDSITAGSPLWDPDPAVREQIGNPIERSQYEYWAQQAERRLDFRNCGVFGERVNQIAMRLEGCAEGADAIVLQGGINNIAQALAGGREALAGAVNGAAVGLDAMVVQAKQLGLDVVLVDVLPWNNGYPAAREEIVELNRRIARIGRERAVPVLPFHDTLEDPSQRERMRPELTIDGDHPSIEGYRRLGELAATRLSHRSSG